MNLHGKRVLVTGAGGFIGSHLVEVLVKQGAMVRAMTHYNSAGSWGNLEFLDRSVLSQVQVMAGDITDSVSVKKGVEKCEVVFHLAALIGIPYSYVAPHSYVSTNIVGTLNVLQACLEAGVGKVVHTSTSEAYGTALYTPIDEKHPLQGQSPYSASKIGADKLAESYFLSHGLPVATIRPFNTFGPRQSARAVIPTIISQALSGTGVIRLGSLTPTRDFNFVQDTVSGFLAMALSDRAVGAVVNFGSGRKVSIGEVANLIIELTGGKLKIENDESRGRPAKSEVMELLCDSTLAHSLCNWSPRYSLKVGLEKTIEFIAQNNHRYKADLYQV